ncbi:MAG: hypothetical protein M1549_00995 [Candidatus Dependentiae bacterium]|nr:hypothetical protein [Candidatus Dependentiae bacterium]
MFSLFEAIARDTGATYRDLFECACEKLGPLLPFRKQARDQILSDIQSFCRHPAGAPPRKAEGERGRPGQSLVYVADRPGGLLFDFVLLHRLIASGITQITLISIEPLLKTVPAIQRAHEQAADYFEQLHTAHPTHPEIELIHFSGWQDYAAAIATDAAPRANALITIDPEDARDLPDPENVHPDYHWHTKIMQMETPFFWAALFQRADGADYRRLFTGTGTYAASCPFIAARQRWGATALERESHQAWLDHRPMLPFATSPRVTAPHASTPRVQTQRGQPRTQPERAQSAPAPLVQHEPALMWRAPGRAAERILMPAQWPATLALQLQTLAHFLAEQGLEGPLPQLTGQEAEQLCELFSAERQE